MPRRYSRSAASLCLLIASTAIGCAGPRTVSPDCAIVRPNEDVLDEQIAEALRAANGDRPILPATFAWIKQLDHDIDLWGK